MLEAARCLTYCNFRIISLGFNRNNESKRIWILFNKFLIRTYNQHKATQWRPRFRVVDAYVRIRKAFTVEYWRKILNSFRLFGIAYIRVIRKKTRFRGSSCNPTSALNGAREVCWFAYIPGQHYISLISVEDRSTVRGTILVNTVLLLKWCIDLTRLRSWVVMLIIISNRAGSTRHGAACKHWNNSWALAESRCCVAYTQLSQTLNFVQPTSVLPRSGAITATPPILFHHNYESQQNNNKRKILFRREGEISLLCLSRVTLLCLQVSF